MAPRVDAFLCVVTYGRTGSTLLQNYLNSFEDVIIRGENGNTLYYLCKLIDIVKTEHNFVLRRNLIESRGSREDSYLRSIVGSPSDPWFGAEGVSIAKVQQDICKLFVDNFIRPESRHRIIGFKEIRWTTNANFFEVILNECCEIFHNTKFIFLTRAWQQVAESYWWRTLPKGEVRERVEKSDALFHKYSEGRSDCLMLDYEELRLGVEGFRRVASFIDRPFDEETALNVHAQRLKHGK